MKTKSSFMLMIAGFSTFLFSLHSSGQDIPLEKLKQMHHEVEADQYLPNAYQNKKTSRPYQYNSDDLRTPTSSEIFTMQVNVDENGQNIIGDAANEPGIAVNPLDKNKMVIGWRQFDNVISNFRQAGWSYTSDGGQSWTFPGVIDPGLFRSDPVLDFDRLGNFYYNSLSANFFCQVFESSNGGATWNSGTDAHGGDKQWMAIDRTTDEGSGNIYSSWNADFSTCTPGDFTRSTDDNFSYEDCISAEGNPWWGTMAVGNSGELYIGGGSDYVDSLVVAKSTDAEVTGSLISWSAQNVYMDGALNGFMPVNPEGLVGQVNIDVDHSDGAGHDNVYLLASLMRLSVPDGADVMFVKSSDGGQTWSSPVRVNDDASVSNTQWLATMSVAPNGRIDAIWLDTRDAPAGSDSSALYYSYSNDQGDSWSANEKLSSPFDQHVGYPNQNKMGDYFDMISDSNSAHLAWTNTLNGEEDVYYSHIIPQISIGINEISHNDRLSVFPNPSNGEFVILNQARPFQIEIHNIVGETIYSASVPATKASLDISSSPAGIYLLKIKNIDGSIVTGKIVKQ